MNIRIFNAIISMLVLIVFVGGCSQTPQVGITPEKETEIHQYCIVNIGNADGERPSSAKIVYTKQDREGYSDIVPGVRVGDFETVWIGPQDGAIMSDKPGRDCPPTPHLQWISPCEPLLHIWVENTIEFSPSKYKSLSSLSKKNWKSLSKRQAARSSARISSCSSKTASPKYCSAKEYVPTTAT